MSLIYFSDKFNKDFISWLYLFKHAADDREAEKSLLDHRSLRETPEHCSPVEGHTHPSCPAPSRPKPQYPRLAESNAIGDNKPHNSMPPYTSAYFFKRKEQKLKNNK